MQQAEKKLSNSSRFYFLPRQPILPIILQRLDLTRRRQHFELSAKNSRSRSLNLARMGSPEN